MSTSPRPFLFLEWIKPAIMSTLAYTVLRLEVCPKCHTKTIEHRGIVDELSVDQCTRCKTAFIDDARRLIG